MAYPPPPYADCPCGGFVCGEAIAGAWWAYAPTGGELLGGYLPDVTATSGNIPPPAGLKLGGFIPTFVGQDAVPPAGLLLGGTLPTLRIGLLVSPPQAGLVLGSILPTLRISSTLSPPAGGLKLGAVVPFSAGQRFALPIECEDVALAGLDCSDEPLAEDSELVLVLDGQECL
jgi:hypothetical protein